MIAARQIAFGKAVGKKEEPPAYWGLCFTAEENGSVVAMEAVGTAPAVTLETSYDGEIWEPFYVGETSITLNKGERVYFKAGEGGNAAMASSQSNYNNKFSLITGRIAASGNIMSLLNGDIPDSVMANYSFACLFLGCTSLITAPELPATKLTDFCYNAMFSGCTSLITAPELPATKLAAQCYNAMFRNCTSLITAPKLLTNTYANNAFANIFYNCTNLNFIEYPLAKFTWGTRVMTTNWVSGVSPTGTFVCPTALGTNDTIKRGVSACPEGWTVINKD